MKHPMIVPLAAVLAAALAMPAAAQDIPPPSEDMPPPVPVEPADPLVPLGEPDVPPVPPTPPVPMEPAVPPVPRSDRAPDVPPVPPQPTPEVPPIPDATTAQQDADRNCMRYTGSRLANRDRTAAVSADELRPGDCISANGRVYSRADLERTGEMDIGDALRRLDPAIR